MARNNADLLVHFVWATWKRMDLLVGDVGEAAYSAIRSEARHMDCTVLALGGMPDHVHLAVEMSTTKTVADIMQQVKAVSSVVARDVAHGDFFAWQHGYGAFTFSRSQLIRVRAYIDNQQQHHTQPQLWPEVEEFGSDQDYVCIMESPDHRA